MLAILYCGKCRAELCEHGEIANDLFEHISEIYLATGKCIEFCTSKYGSFYRLIAIIRFLEFKRYIVTTECSEYLLKIKPLGIECEQSGKIQIFYICFDKEHPRFHE
jgi:hypothetical protein